MEDSERHGNGPIQIALWALLMPLFHILRKPFYAVAALRLVAFSRGLRGNVIQHQTTWERVSMLAAYHKQSVREGKNVSTDKLVEWFVKLIKQEIKTMGPNRTSHTMDRAARLIIPIDQLTKKSR